MKEIKKYKDNLIGTLMYKTKLSCGMNAHFITLHKDVALSIVHLFTRFGSIDAKFKNQTSNEILEIPDGTAHFLEHSAFYDSDGKNALQVMKAMGLSGNAWTEFDHTTYHFGSVDDNKRKNLDYLISFVSTPYFTNECVKKEQGVISQEIAMYKDQPGWELDEELRLALMKEHPLRRSLGGEKKSIMRITKEDLKSAYDTFYHPSNLNLVIMAPVKSTPLMEAKAYFELAEDICNSKGFTQKAPPEYLYIEEPAEVSKKKVKLRHNVPEPLMAIGFKGCMHTRGTQFERMKEKLTNELLAATLFDMGSEDIYSLVKEGIARSSDFKGKYQSFRGCDYFHVTSSSFNPTAFEEKIIKIIKEGVNGKLSKELFELKKKKIIASQAALPQLENTVAFEMNIIYALAADLNPLDKVKVLKSVTYEDVLEAGKKYLDTDNYSVVVMNPRDQPKASK